MKYLLKKYCLKNDELFGKIIIILKIGLNRYLKEENINFKIV
jgi:hypothetical protein